MRRVIDKYVANDVSLTSRHPQERRDEYGTEIVVKGISMVGLSGSEEKEFQKVMGELAQDPRCLRMKKYIQHGHITTYDHCLDVAREAFWLNRRLRLRAEERRLVRAAFLHDYFLYDWHSHGDHLHGYHHPHIAALNAGRDFQLDAVEIAAIESHMWPLTLFHAPSSRIAWLVTAADKICSSRETLFER